MDEAETSREFKFWSRGYNDAMKQMRITIREVLPHLTDERLREFMEIWSRDEPAWQESNPRPRPLETVGSVH